VDVPAIGTASDEAAPKEPERAPARAVRVGFIVGPTGSGKSAIAVDIAERLGAEIVNADSRQLYRAMDIGTAKPSADERRRVPHHLFDVRAPDQPLDVATFVEMAREAISAIAARGRPVLAVGGSGLYLRALRGGIFSGPSASAEIRAELAAIAAERGASFLYERLGRIDPVSATRIQPNDLYRIVRALEVHRLTGVPMSVHQQQHRFRTGDFASLTVGISVARKELYEAINRRFDTMVAAGLVGEVRALLAAGFSPERPPLSTIGYKQIAAFVRGEVSLEAAAETAKRETRRLAKRQLTWFRHEPAVVWIDAARAREEALIRFREFFSQNEGGV
jgi:tRNA dimethylallyltransferase